MLFNKIYTIIHQNKFYGTKKSKSYTRIFPRKVKQISAPKKYRNLFNK